MINLYVARNNCGKTTLLRQKHDVLKNQKNEMCLFFQIGNEIQASINKDDSKSNGLTIENPIYSIINQVIKQNEDPKDKVFDELKNKYSTFLRGLKKQYDKLPKLVNEVINKNISDLLNENFDSDENKLQPLNFMPNFKLGKNNISTGEIQISNIFISLKWLHLLDPGKGNNQKINIFFDEPETYLHPQYIKTLCENIIYLNYNKNIDFYISTHNPQIISLLINSSNNNNNNINVYVRKSKYDEEKEPAAIENLFEKIECSKDKYISANQILYDVYDVCSIEYFDELLLELDILKNKISDQSKKDEVEKIKYMITGRSDKNYHTTYKATLNDVSFSNAFIDKVYYHITYMSFVRNYFHHLSEKYYDFVKNLKNEIKFSNLNPGKILDNLLQKSIKWLLTKIKELEE